MLLSGTTRFLRNALVLATLFALGCAYYNTLFNAKKRYREAEVVQRDAEGRVPRQGVAMYDEVIVKCRKMIETWPKSRHVDDAMLLIGQSYYGSDRFTQCVEVLDSLTLILPDTELMPRVLSLKGSAHAKSGDHEEAVAVLVDRVERYDVTPGSLYYLSTSLMSLGRSDEAVEYLAKLEEEFPDEDETFDARLTIAEILSEREKYEESRAVYERLTSRRLPEVFRYGVWMGYARVNVNLERYAEALETIDLVRELTLNPNDEPPVLLLRAEALAGADSLDSSIATYDDITARFARGEFAAQAHYHLAQIYEEMDSLETAMHHYEEVSRAYANFEYAREALKRSNDLSQLMKLEATADDNSPEALAYRQFSMAELQLFEFNNTQKALGAYQLILDEYPDTEYGPKAAYAVAYIHATIEVDSALALESVRYLLERYPGTQQSTYADQLVESIGADLPEVAPGLAPWEPARRDTVGSAADTTAAERTTAVADTTVAGGSTATPDTVFVPRAPALGDTTEAKGAPAAVDTTVAKGAPASGDSTEVERAPATADTAVVDSATAAADTTAEGDADAEED